VPFLRVIRDKRGYETTYLMDWYREGTRQRSRILYVFRTPGGVRVGRAPLEPDVLRHIEAQYPQIAFDWKSVFDTRQVIDSAPESRRPPRRRTDEETAAPAAPVKVESSGTPPSAAPSRPPIPAVIEGATADERVAFLLHWYPIARDRVTQRVADPLRREALMSLTERLNPAAWTDADEVATGLQHASEALERLSRVLTRRRRRSARTNRPERINAESVQSGEEVRTPHAVPAADPTDLSPTGE
jgi:hypothetical protein